MNYQISQSCSAAIGCHNYAGTPWPSDSKLCSYFLTPARLLCMLLSLIRLIYDLVGISNGPRAVC